MMCLKVRSILFVKGGFRAERSRGRVPDLEPVSAKVPGPPKLEIPEFRVSGLGFRLWGLGFRVEPETSIPARGG